MNQKDSTLIRVSRDTKQQLEELAALWRSLWYNGRMDVPAPNDRDNISLDRVIFELLTRDRAHRTRSKRSSAAKRAADEQPTEDGPQDADEQP